MVFYMELSNFTKGINLNFEDLTSPRGLIDIADVAIPSMGLNY